jgi:RNA polymerase sigma factor (sigma-70 family)
MNAARPAEILRRLEQPTGAPDADAALLARFAATRDAVAFAELVRRHGALVFGVCRRVTGHPQDAEDAFQAVFLVLARKAGSLRDPALLGNWLYGVAFRVASRAKRSAVRRRAREVPVSVLPDQPAPAPARVVAEFAPILDEELAALPACYREAIVLCDLRGASREEAAVALGIPEGTLSSRLANGRKKLAARLTKRGVALSVAALPLALAEAQAATVVPIELLRKTCGVVSDWGSGVPVPGPLVRLAEGGLAVRRMLVLGVVMVVGVAGAVWAARPGAPPVEPPKPAVVAERPDAVPEQEGEPKSKPEQKPGEKAAFTTTPKMQYAFDLRVRNISTIIWNAAGTYLALTGECALPSDISKRQKVAWLCSIPEGFGPRYCYPGELSELVAITPTGDELFTALREYHLISGHHQLTGWTDRGRLGGAQRELIATQSPELDLPATSEYVFAADGKSFRTVESDFKGGAGIRPKARGAITRKIEVLEVDVKTGKAVKSLLKLECSAHAISPDGKRFAVLDKGAKTVTVYDLDRETKLSEYSVPAEPPEVAIENPESIDLRLLRGYLVFSSDGRRLLVSRSIGQTHVLNTDTGEALPALEGTKKARTYPEAFAFGANGRLLVSLVASYEPMMRATDDGKRAGLALGREVLTVWDTQSGKVLKTWNVTPQVAFNPVKPVLAIFEPNGDWETRIGFWDFALVAEKK